MSTKPTHYLLHHDDIVAQMESTNIISHKKPTKTKAKSMKNIDNEIARRVNARDNVLANTSYKIQVNQQQQA